MRNLPNHRRHVAAALGTLLVVVLCLVVTTPPVSSQSGHHRPRHGTTTTTTVLPPTTTTTQPPATEPTIIAGRGYVQTFEDNFDSRSPLWVELPWFDWPWHGVTVANGVMTIATEPGNPGTDHNGGEAVSSLGPRSATFPHYPQAKTWDGIDAANNGAVYFETRLRYTNNPWTYMAWWLYSSGRAQLYPNSDAWCPNTNPEWDIMEGNLASYGADRLMTMGLHKNTNGYCGVPDVVDVNWGPDHGSGLSDWHVWSGWWIDGALILYLDGVPETYMPHNGWLNDDMFMIYQIGQNYTTPPGNPPKASQYELQVDYLRVWERP